MWSEYILSSPGLDESELCYYELLDFMGIKII